MMNQHRVVHAFSSFPSFFSTTKYQRLCSKLFQQQEEKEKDSSITNQEDDEKKDCYSFGVIADIQYAPIPDGTSFTGVPRFYRHALETTKVASNHFQKLGLPCVVNLGDIIDGKCQDIASHGGTTTPGHPGVECTRDVLNAFSSYQCGEIYHTYGNHELYNMDRHTIGNLLNIPFVNERGNNNNNNNNDDDDELVGYRSISIPDTNIMFIVLDSYDITVLKRSFKRRWSWSTSSSSSSQNDDDAQSTTFRTPKGKKANDILLENNPIYGKTTTSDNNTTTFNSAEGLEGVDKRFVGFNGAVGPIQLQWLERTLRQARADKKICIILSHQPILPGSCADITLIWNYNQVLSILRRYSDIIMLSLAGHAHKGGYRRDAKSGIHFRVIEAALETPSPGHTYGIIHVYPTERKIIIEGMGDCQSAEYDLNHLYETRRPKGRVAWR